MCEPYECYLVEMGYWVDKKRGIFKRNQIMPYALSGSIIKQRKSVGVFNTAYKYNTENQNDAYLYGDLYFDFDSKDNFEAVREDTQYTLKYLKSGYNIDAGDTKIYFSGNKGFHIIIPAEAIGIKPSKELNQIFKYISLKIRNYTPNKTLDPVIYDSKRMFRIPGTIHENTGLYKVPVTFEELNNLSHEEIKDIAKENRKLKFKKPHMSIDTNSMYLKEIKAFEENKKIKRKIKPNDNYKLDYTPPCIKKLLEEGAANGNRNNKGALVASFYKSCGIDSNEAMQLLLEWNDKNSPPMSDYETRSIVKNIYAHNKTYGCSTLSILCDCDKEKCKFKKGGRKNEI